MVWEGESMLKAIYVLVDERDYIELRKRLLEEGKTLATVEELDGADDVSDLKSALE